MIGSIVGLYAFFIFLVGILVGYLLERKVSKMDEGDIYIRDHLLIEFMIERKYHPFTDIEDMYKDWREWLKEREEKHDEGRV